MKKILLLADPNSIHTKKWSEGWKLIGYDSIISGVASCEDFIYNNDLIIKEDINPLGGNGFKYIKNIFNFKKILKNIDPIILNPHYLTSYGFIGALIKRKKDFLVMSLHGTDIMKTMDRNFIYLLMAKYIFYKSDLIVSVSDIMTNKILKYFPILKDKIITQQYGVDIKLLNSFYTKNKNIFISTNRQWKPNSNYPIILKALSYFTDKYMKIIGAYDDKYSQDLLNNYPMLKKYSTGVVSYETNLKYVAQSKIFISLTSSDGIPLSLVEAMYLGAIPIVSDIGPNRELIEDGINGFLVPIEAESLKNKIKEVDNLSEKTIKAIQEYNKNLVLEKFDFEFNFQKLSYIINDKMGIKK